MGRQSVNVPALRMGISVCCFFCGVAVPIAVAASPRAATIINPRSATVVSGGDVQFVATVAGKPVDAMTWYVNGIAGGSPAVGAISVNGLYTAPPVSTPCTFLITTYSNWKELSSRSALAEGQVTTTSHPLVAKYTFLAPPESTVQIQFGPDENYGQERWEQRAGPHGGEVDTLVAGMRANSLYHMRAQLKLADGSLFWDDDHTLATGSIPTDRLPTITATTMPGQAPQPGVELVDAVQPPVPTEWRSRF